jgi:hypothetical protein
MSHQLADGVVNLRYGPPQEMRAQDLLHVRRTDGEGRAAASAVTRRKQRREAFASGRKGPGPLMGSRVDLARLLAVKVRLPVVEAPQRGILTPPSFVRRQPQVLAFGT